MANNNVDLVLADDAQGSLTAGSGVAGGSAVTQAANLNGIALKGTFALTAQNALSFLAGENGAVRNLIVRLAEEARNTGNFVQLQHAASLNVKVDMRKMIKFQPDGTDAGLDDAYEMRPCKIAFGSGVANSVPKTNWALSLDAALKNGDGFDANKATYDAATKSLVSHFVPVGAVIVALPDLSASGGSVQLTSNGGAASFQVAQANAKFGLSLFGQLKYDEANVATGSGQLSVTATFDPPAGSNIIGGAGRHNEITVSLLNMEDFRTAQRAVIKRADGETGSFSHANADDNSLQATDADDFDLVVSLADLGSESDPTTVGGSMVSAIQASVGGELLTAWEVNVEKIESKTDSELSGFLRSISHADGAAVAGRTPAEPLLNTETFIIRNTAPITVSLQPFNYTFGDAASASVASFNFINNLPVHAVLEHVKGSSTLVLDTETSQLLSA